MDFYLHARAPARLSAQHARDVGRGLLGGAKGAASYVVYARELPNGGSSVDRKRRLSLERRRAD